MGTNRGSHDLCRLQANDQLMKAMKDSVSSNTRMKINTMDDKDYPRGKKLIFKFVI